MRKIGILIAAVLIAGCSRAPSELEVTQTSFNSAGAPTIEFSVPDMMCPESCAVKTKEILSEQPGVTDVVVDFDSKTATVAVDKDVFDADAAIAALVDHSFVHSALKGDAGSTQAKPAETAASDLATPEAPVR
jgi:copper chaperone CopZ